MSGRSRVRPKRVRSSKNSFFQLGLHIGVGKKLLPRNSEHAWAISQNKKLEKKVTAITQTDAWVSQTVKFATLKQQPFGSFEAMLAAYETAGQGRGRIRALEASISGEMYRHVIEGEDPVLQDLANKQDVKSFNRAKDLFLRRISQHMNGSYGIASNHPTLDRNLLQRIWYHKVKQGKLFPEIDKIERLPNNRRDLIFSGARSKSAFHKFQKRELTRFREFFFFTQELLLRMALQANLENFFNERLKAREVGTKHTYSRALKNIRLLRECKANLKKLLADLNYV